MVGFAVRAAIDCLAGLSLLAATVSCFSRERFRLKINPRNWIRPRGCLPFQFSRRQVSTFGCDHLALYALVCSPIAVLSVMQGDSTWSLANIWTRPAPLTYALASITLLLSTRAFRVSAIYVASIAFAFAAFHSAAQWAWNHGWWETDVTSVHLFVGSVLSLAGCLIAIVLTWWFNRRIPSLDIERQTAFRSNREFYAGLLHHVALLTAATVLFGLAGMALFDSYSFARFAPIHALTAGILTAAFSISGFIYLSRLHTYGALTAIVVAMSAAVSMWASPANYLVDQAVAGSVMALAFGIASLLLSSPNRIGSEAEAERQGMSWRFNQVWQRPPLPLVSRDRTLWAKPLAHASTALALAAVVPVVIMQGRFPVWLTVLPIYLASCTWLIATYTYGFGLIEGLDHLSKPAGKHAGFEIRFFRATIAVCRFHPCVWCRDSRHGAVGRLYRLSGPLGRRLAPGPCRLLVAARMGCGDDDRRAAARHDHGWRECLVES